VPYRNPNELLRARRSTYRLLLRFAASGSSAASSRLAALPRSPWLQPARSRPPLASIHFEQLDRTLVLPPRALLDRVCRAVPRACNGQAVFSSIEALACSTPTNGCCFRRKDECESREENLLAADRRRKDQVGSRIGKKDGECMRRPSQMRTIEGYSRGKMSVWLHGDVSPASCVSEIAGHTRAHAEARGDLHGRRHLHTLRTRTPVPSQRAACSGLRTERRKFCALQRAPALKRLR
jgi:hypothetical protein